MKISLKVVPIFLVLIGCVANQEVEENITNKNNPSQAPAAANDNKICRQISVSGSRLKKKVCSTVEEEEDRAKKSQRILREQQNRERVRSGMPDPG